MDERRFAEKDVQEVINRYPGLELKSPGVLEGVLNMHAVFNGIAIKGDFLVQIRTDNPYSHRIPALLEVGGRTQQIAEKYRIQDPRTLHSNLDGTACVCIKQLEKIKFPDGSSLLRYVEELAVPYLYALSYYDTHRRWPWGDYSHGSLGLLEFYEGNIYPLDNNDMTEVLNILSSDPNWNRFAKQLRKPSAKRECLCGSGKRFGRCHNRAWRGLIQLREELERLEWNLGALKG